jgi:hypothetical protein
MILVQNYFQSDAISKQWASLVLHLADGTAFYCVKLIKHDSPITIAPTFVPTIEPTIEPTATPILPPNQIHSRNKTEERRLIPIVLGIVFAVSFLSLMAYYFFIKPNINYEDGTPLFHQIPNEEDEY